MKKLICILTVIIPGIASVVAIERYDGKYYHVINFGGQYQLVESVY